jgi:hypothetical protein
MKLKIVSTIVAVAALIATPTLAIEKPMPKLENPVTVEFLKQNLRTEHPRLGLTPDLEADIQARLTSDPVLQNVYQTMKRNAENIFDEPLLTRKQIGRRLLSTSREMLWRINTLAFVYRMEKSPKILTRINDELLAVSAFSDWNPSHFLDVAEMSMAVAVGLDWTAGDLSEESYHTIREALIEKGLKTDDGSTRIVNGTNNWNQVCNGGMIAAALVVAEVEPELAVAAIGGALDAIPNALSHYGPDGVYPEGSTYWGYGTMFTAMTSSILETALGTDFGIFEYPGLYESAMYRVVMNAPSGQYYDYGDCGNRRSEPGDITLAWFASKTGDSTYFEKERFLLPPEKLGKMDRHVGFGTVWLSQIEERQASMVPTVWSGRGINPVAIFQGGQDDPRNYYLGTKGGYASLSHGSMDAGSFIFELNGIRWALELGNQSYHELEETGFKLWGKDQDSERWTLLSKNNLGHNTLTINGAHHVVDGAATLIYCKKEPTPEAAFDISLTFGDLVTKATRTFTKDGEASFVITDSIVESEKTKMITWQMLTVAEVEVVAGGALLKQNNKVLKLQNTSHPEIEVSIVSLYPPPHKLDKQIDGLKRLEIRVPGASVSGTEVELKVRLSEG